MWNQNNSKIVKENLKCCFEFLFTCQQLEVNKYCNLVLQKLLVLIPNRKQI